MQSDADNQDLLHSAAFQQLLSKKTKVTLRLSAAMMIVYSLYFIGIAYFPEWMGAPASDFSTISIGIYFTVFCIVFSVFLSGFYIWWANQHFDKALRELLRDFSHEKK